MASDKFDPIHVKMQTRDGRVIASGVLDGPVEVQPDVTLGLMGSGSTMRPAKMTILSDTPPVTLPALDQRSREYKRALWPCWYNGKQSPGRTIHGLERHEAWCDGFDTGILFQMYDDVDTRNPHGAKSALHAEWERGFQEGASCG